ncbi:MAG TPA: CoA transferase [Ilumatobacter sp.]|nr:CoA transferase [Ilumatobacter sp.]
MGKPGPLSGTRVVEIGDETVEYAGLLLMGLGAEVVKVEPPEGAPSRRIGPFVGGRPNPERSLFFWHYNRGKRSVCLDLDGAEGRDSLARLVAGADVVVDSTPRGRLAEVGCALDDLRARHPGLITARVTPFGDDGPWADYRGSDLVHLALGGVAMNCGYDPRPDGTYDLPPMAPQMWQSYHIAGEQVAMGVLAAYFVRLRTGAGQHVSLAVHEAVAKNTEIDLMSWVMRRQPVYRQTCRHATERVSPAPLIQQTKDGRWIMTTIVGAKDQHNVVAFLEKYGMRGGLAESTQATDVRAIPGSSADDMEQAAQAMDMMQRLVRKFTYAEFPWREAQDAGLFCVPLRRPEENVDDDHWTVRGTYSTVEHEGFGPLPYATSKWLSTATDWQVGGPAPRLDADRAILDRPSDEPVRIVAVHEPVRGSTAEVTSALGKPFALGGVRIFDFGWFLASAGGTRFLAALGAEVIKVEWAANPDTRMGAMAPVGGRAARSAATAPLDGVTDRDMGGQFNNKNPGKLGISLNVRHPRGLEIARELVRISDVVSEGFSPGVMDRWGLGYDELRKIRPDVIYAQQSGMGSAGSYGRFRAIGPIAASLAGLSEMSGLPSPAMPVGWGYSYLDWIGAYSFASAILGALVHRERTGEGQWIDASQTETGLFVSGTALLDRAVNGQAWERTGNRSPHVSAAPHGIYPCAGTDRWIAIACFDDAQWAALGAVAGRPAWSAEPAWATLAGRVADQDRLDRAVTGWTATQDRYELMHRLQAAGVAAGVCQTAEDRCDTDPQLAHLGWLTEVTGTKIGTWPVAEVPVRLQDTPPHVGGPIQRGAPGYGEDNEYVLGDLLGLSSGEISRLIDDNVV